ncbi:PREDICTED: uncharacterized protein LOC109235268 [Nicotiana attenuata]|uniref:uncharacterized protein LOC109235268 n=1 Tax=Nicotiana attenuata TaxID=49451 RepID=UPI00090510E1|nr:PREDICTED: uncharacterized protein LOC109235268 [Nicotiana attenuata]
MPAINLLSVSLCSSSFSALHLQISFSTSPVNRSSFHLFEVIEKDVEASPLKNKTGYSIWDVEARDEQVTFQKSLLAPSDYSMEGSEQYSFMEHCLASVDKQKRP